MTPAYRCRQWLAIAGRLHDRSIVAVRRDLVELAIIIGGILRVTHLDRAFCGTFRSSLICGCAMPSPCPNAPCISPCRDPKATSAR